MNPTLEEEMQSSTSIPSSYPRHMPNSFVQLSKISFNQSHQYFSLVLQ